MKNQNSHEMWKNALTQTDEKYIAEGAELAPESENIIISPANEKHGTGNLGFVFAAAAAVIVSFIGVGFFLKGTGIEPLSPSAGSIGASSADDASGNEGTSGTMTTTIVMDENGEIVTIVSRSDDMETTTVEVPTTSPETEKRPLTLADVVSLSQKGDNLTWSDFDSFEGKDVGSGLYIMCYEINDEYTVMVGGVPTETPWYIRLIRNFGKDNEEYINIRTDDVLDFLSRPSAPGGHYSVKDDVLYISDAVTVIPAYMFSKSNDFTQVSIPASVEKIGDYAFAHSAVESVVFEGTVEIGDYAFTDCKNLKQIAFLGDIRNIGDYAFSDCSLENVILPDSFTNLGQHAFLNNKNIKITYGGKVYDNDSLYALELATTENAIRNLEQLVSGSTLKITEGTTKIEAHAFEGADNFTEVIIPEGITEIGDYAFAETNVKKITLPQSLEKIGDYAFYMSTLEEIVIPSGVKEIGYSAFDRCLNLERVTLKSGVEKIGERAFMMCSMLTDIEIPDTVTEIGSEAFTGTGLYSVTIPASVASIGSGAFSNCIMLEDVVFEGSMKAIPDNCFSSCSALRSVKLPEGVHSIGSGAFYYCTSLDIVLPDTVKTISDGAFAGCTQFDGTVKPSEFDPETMKPVTSDNFTIIRPVDSTFITTDYSEGEGGHDGIDYAGELGDNIYAAADGVVTAIETEYDDKGYGKYVIIDHGNGYTTCYTHMDSISVEMLDEVSAGDVIGKMGSTGWSTGPHLHFVLAKNSVAVDPHIYLGDPIQLIAPTGDVYPGDDILFEYGGYTGLEGIIYGGEKGQNVVTAANGTVSFAGWDGHYGNCVIIDHRDGYQTVYAHLDEIKVKAGDKVTTGHLVGTMGDSGYATGVMLEFELRKDSIKLNPADYIA